MKKIIITLIFTTAFMSTLTTQVSAAVSSGTGTLYPTVSPGETMYSIEEIYNLLTASTTATIGEGEFLPATPKVNGTISLVDLYNAALALKNSVVVDDTPEDPEPTIVPDGSESFVFVGTMRVLDTWTSGRYGFRFTATASNVDLYIPKAANLDHVKINGLTATNAVQTVSALITSTDAVDSGSYWKVPAGTTASFSNTVTLENLGGTTALTNGTLTLSAIEYKNTSSTGSMNVFNTNVAEFIITEISLNTL